MSRDFLSAIENRRTIYALSDKETVSRERIQEIVAQTVKHVPSGFNSQSQRVVVLFGDEHKKLWDITRDTLKPIVPEAAWKSTQDKMDSFKAGYGTVLFFDESAITEGLMKQYALYADNFPVWASQSVGMLQFAVWTALSDEGLGASLQHYNPLIDEAVAKEWNLPKSWKLLGQMPFGSVAAPAGEKQFAPLAERMLVKGL